MGLECMGLGVQGLSFSLFVGGGMFPSLESLLHLLWAQIMILRT